MEHLGNMGLLAGHSKCMDINVHPLVHKIAEQLNGKNGNARHCIPYIELFN